MNKKWLKWMYEKIRPSITQWLPRYYAVLRLIKIGEGFILDASCGTGDTTIELKKKGAKIVGINISKEEVMLALKKAEREGVKIDFVIGDLTNAPFKDKTFSLIISLDTLEHIEGDDKVFREFARMLKLSGKLILSVPYGATNSAELFREQRILRKFMPCFLYTNASFNGKSWLEATEEDAMKEMGHFRNYSVGKLKKKTTSFFEINTHYEYALKKFASLATDITYGIKGFSSLKPLIFFIAVRLDRYLQKNKKGYLLVCEFQRNRESRILVN
jgi:ubiquinone/menaquinone biosynthesis C-methylase UbiE